MSSKCPATVGAEVRLDVRMHLFVLCKLRRPSEPALARGALERLLSGVRSHVIFKKSGLSKLFSTLVTNAGFLSGVPRLLVITEVGVLAKLHPAVRALVRLLASVDTQVDLENLFFRKAPATEMANVRSDARMDEHVRLELRGGLI